MGVVDYDIVCCVMGKAAARAAGPRGGRWGQVADRWWMSTGQWEWMAAVVGSDGGQVDSGEGVRGVSGGLVGVGGGWEVSVCGRGSRCVKICGGGTGATLLSRLLIY